MDPWCGQYALAPAGLAVASGFSRCQTSSQAARRTVRIAKTKYPNLDSWTGRAPLTRSLTPAICSWSCICQNVCGNQRLEMGGAGSGWRPMRHIDYREWAGGEFGDERQVYALDKHSGLLVFLPDGQAEQFRDRAKKEELVCPVPGCPSPRLNTRGGERRDHFYHERAPNDPGHNRAYSTIATQHFLMEWIRNQDEDVEVLDEDIEDVRVTLMLKLPDGTRLALCYVNYKLGAAEWMRQHRSLTAEGIVDVWLFAPLETYFELPNPEQAPAGDADYSSASGNSGLILDQLIYQTMRDQGLWPLIINLEMSQLANVIPPRGKRAEKLGLVSPFEEGVQHIAVYDIRQCHLDPCGIATPAANGYVLKLGRYGKHRDRTPKRRSSRRTRRSTTSRPAPAPDGEAVQAEPVPKESPPIEILPSPKISPPAQEETPPDPPEAPPRPQPSLPQTSPSQPASPPPPNAAKNPSRQGRPSWVAPLIVVILIIIAWSLIKSHHSNKGLPADAPPLLVQAARVYPNDCNTITPELKAARLAVQCTIRSPAYAVTYEQIPQKTNVTTLDRQISRLLAVNHMSTECSEFGATRWRIPHNKAAGAVVCRETKLLWCDWSKHIVGFIEQGEELPPSIIGIWSRAIAAQYPSAGRDPKIEAVGTPDNRC